MGFNWRDRNLEAEARQGMREVRKLDAQGLALHLIVTGGRQFNDRCFVAQVLDRAPRATVFADRWAHRVARSSASAASRYDDRNHGAQTMCGRDSAFHTWKQVWEFSQPMTLDLPLPDPTPNYNRAPTHLAGVVIALENGGGVAREMRWGLIPFWAKDGKVVYTTSNARVKTASTKPALREAWKRRRAWCRRQVTSNGKSWQTETRSSRTSSAMRSRPS